MWPTTDPIGVHSQPQLGQHLLWTIPGDSAVTLQLRVTVLERQLTQLDLRLADVEARLARPWWGARLWTWLLTRWDALS